MTDGGYDQSLNPELGCGSCPLEDIEEQTIETKAVAGSRPARANSRPVVEIPGVALAQPVFPRVLPRICSCSSQASRYHASGTICGFFICCIASDFASWKALYMLIATHGCRSMTSCLMPTTCMIWEDAGLAVKRHLLLLVVRKQPPDAGVARHQQLDEVRRQQCVDLTRDQHVFKRALFADRAMSRPGGGVKSTSSSSSLSHLIDLCGTP